MNIAFLIIDVQKAFLEDRKNSKEYQDTLMYINATASLFRKANQHIYIIRDISEGNDESYSTVDKLKTSEKDIDIIKKYSNSFWKTNLEEKLKEKNIDFVVISGNALEHCVLATYFGAQERGFQAAILQHGVFADYKEGIMDLYNNRALVSYEVLHYLLRDKTVLSEN